MLYTLFYMKAWLMQNNIYVQNMRSYENFIILQFYIENLLNAQ